MLKSPRQSGVKGEAYGIGYRIRFAPVSLCIMIPTHQKFYFGGAIKDLQYEAKKFPPGRLQISNTCKLLPRFATI